MYHPITSAPAETGGSIDVRGLEKHHQQELQIMPAGLLKNKGKENPAVDGRSRIYKL